MVEIFEFRNNQRFRTSRTLVCLVLEWSERSSNTVGFRFADDCDQPCSRNPFNSSFNNSIQYSIEQLNKTIMRHDSYLK